MSHQDRERRDLKICPKPIFIKVVTMWRLISSSFNTLEFFSRNIKASSFSFYSLPHISPFNRKTFLCCLPLWFQDTQYPWCFVKYDSFLSNGFSITAETGKFRREAQTLHKCLSLPKTPSPQVPQRKTAWGTRPAHTGLSFRPSHSPSHHSHSRRFRTRLPIPTFSLPGTFESPNRNPGSPLVYQS